MVPISSLYRHAQGYRKMGYNTREKYYQNITHPSYLRSSVRYETSHKYHLSSY